MPENRLLFQPLTLRGVTIPNRIVSTGHQTFLAKDGQITDALIAYHAARAKGGAGLIIMESARYHESAFSDLPEIHIHTDDGIAGFAKLAKAVQAHGTRIFGQLSHSGRCSHRRIDGVRDVVYAPSPVPDNRFHTMPRAMPAAMVEDVIASCGAAARRMGEAGLDGVEVLVSHGLLFAQFLNPLTNLRTDCYGGSFENRIRPLAESLKRVRAALGPDRVVGIRISASETEPDGMEEDLARDACRYLAEHKLVDYINTTIGSMAGPGGSIHVVPPMEYASGYVAKHAGSIRAATGLPVFVAGRINQPQDAEKILAAGQADLCGMTRAMIADSDMPGKAKAEAYDTIRACIGCNQGCIGHFHQGYSITCIQNPRSGRETKIPLPTPTGDPKSILVAGAGPAGLKAASIAASQGHRVLICEASAQVGGQVNLAAQLPNRAEFGGLVSNLLAELDRLGVEIRRNTPVSAALVDDLAPDALVVATGARPYYPPIEGGENAHILTAHDILQGNAKPGSRVLIADWRCDWVGMGLAEKLALEGHHVRLAVNGMQAGYELQPYQRDHLIGRLHTAGVEILPYARLFGVDEDTVYLTHTITGEAIMCEAVDTLVLAYGTTANTELETALEGQSVPIFLAGDCLSPRTAEEAVLEGMRAAMSL